MGFVFVGVLLLCFVTSIYGEVVRSFERESCTKYFYQRTEPSFAIQRGYRRICQMNIDVDPDKDFFATLYDTTRKIPVYSAYVLTVGENVDRPRWYIEPQLESRSLTKYMYTSWLAENSTLLNITKQAVDKGDYTGSGFNRGHVSPHSYHAGADRKAAATLTNVVPQYEEFNQRSWARAEQAAYKIMTEYCFGNKKTTQVPYKKTYPDATAYFVTGAIPGDESDFIGNNVNIPKISFTAACCSDPTRGKEFSFGYYGYNVADEKEQHTQAVDVSKLEGIVQDKWPGEQTGIEFFADGCNTEGSEKYVNAMNKLIKKS